MTISILLILLTAQKTLASPACLTTREFITSLEFLRSDADFKMKDTEAQDLSLKISAGCTGAAKRFVRVAKTLTQSGANRKNAAELAISFSNATDDQTDAFLSAFRLSIAEDGLDMDFQNSIRIALSVSKEYSGDLKFAQKDFEKIISECSDSRKLAIPRVDCGNFAAKIARSGSAWESGAAEPFLETLEFLTSSSGPSLTHSDAILVAEKIAGLGPSSKENFKQAYQYAVSTSGLSLNRNQAIAFAKKMAQIEEIKTPATTTVQEKVK